ncbi:MAG TPA: transcription termination/antitermination protein NusG [Nitrospirales bacterium]|nr:transcription termination/antitermination protein NusG [Nitrospirales bacterium]
MSENSVMGKNWYVVHTYAGFEGRVKDSILERASQMGLQDKIGQVLVPTEDVIEIKEGKKRTSTRKFFPGYVLVEMDMSNESWQMIKETPKVTGFVGGGSQPIPMTQEEIETLLKQIDGGTAVPRQKEEFHKGDSVRIIDGPFLGFNGMVDDVDEERSRLKVLVSIFGRGTPVELGFLQVERL